jgi:hypothetical protein
VTNGFTISAAQATKGRAFNNAFQVNEEFSMVRGRHQIGIGANVACGGWSSFSWSRGNGDFTFNGQIAGLGLADFLLGPHRHLHARQQNGRGLQTVVTSGRMRRIPGAPPTASTVNAGLRWEPFSGQQVEGASLGHFSLDRFKQGLKSSQFINAPAGDDLLRR